MKKALRQQIRNLKRVFMDGTPLSEQRDISAQLLRRVEQLPQFREARVVLAYYSLPDEVFTHDIINHWAQRKLVILPKVVGDSLTLHRYTGAASLREGAFGIMEPSTPEFVDYAAIDFVLVPGVAFDGDGNRLGRGRGYYDRLFANQLPPTVFKLGICYPFQFVPHVPADPTDIPMNLVLSE